MAGRAGKTVYHSRQWRIVRRQVLDRDNWTCTNCGGRGRMEVDYIRPISRGGKPFDLNNLRALCRTCHVKISGKLSRKPPPERAAWDKLVNELT